MKFLITQILSSAEFVRISFDLFLAKSKPKKPTPVQNHNANNTKSEDQDLDTSGFASETTEQEVGLLKKLYLSFVK